MFENTMTTFAEAAAALAALFEDNPEYLCEPNAPITPDYTPNVQANPEDVAKELGLVCRWPEKWELFVDVDSQDQMREVLENVKIWNSLPSKYNLVVAECTPSRTAGHFHLVVHVTYRTGGTRAALNPAFKVLLQTALGGDPRRNLFNAIRFFGKADGLPAYDKSFPLNYAADVHGGGCFFEEPSAKLEEK